MTPEAVGSMPIAQLEHAYKQLGLLNASDDFKIALEKYHRLERLIYYDSATDRLLIAADAATLGAQLAMRLHSRRSRATGHCGDRPRAARAALPVARKNQPDRC